MCMNLPEAKSIFYIFFCIRLGQLEVSERRKIVDNQPCNLKKKISFFGKLDFIFTFALKIQNFFNDEPLMDEAEGIEGDLWLSGNRTLISLNLSSK